MLITLKNFEKDGVTYGQYFENGQIYIFFGNKNFEKHHFTFFPEIKFQTLKQVHGNNVVYWDRYSDEVTQADAHYTATKNLGLAIQTADCLPIFGFDQNQKWIFAAHAGWRGVENKITKILLQRFSQDSNSVFLSLFIGPHIQKESFEVDEDVSEKLKKCTENENCHSYFDETKNKHFVDLKKIVHTQVLELPLQIQELYFSKIDTLTNSDYSSFRRQKGPCRNWSFIYLK